MKKTFVMFLWHNHQPYYKNDITGKYILPWVRLHAVKDYYDTLAVVEKYPKVKLNFNLVPSLLLQIKDYIENGTRDDFFYVSQKNAQNLTNEEKVFLLKNFFMCNWETMIDSYPRYKVLLDIRGRDKRNEDFTLEKFLQDKKLQSLDMNYYRDLQTWFNLTWIDPYFRELDNFRFIDDLVKKGENFTEEEKNLVLEIHIEIMKMVLPKYKELLKNKQIEISTTPFYHPILPLLVDNSIAKISSPYKNSPKNVFKYKEDAISQIKNGIEYFESIFEEKPKGMWPSEGSVSDDVLNIFADLGIKWVATDEDVLFNSLKNIPFDRNNLYSGYKYKDLDLSLFFRDKKLSDLIGFSYSKMDPVDAVNNFFSNLENIRNNISANNESDNIIPIILDGENCWEYFKNDGNDFLNELYKRFQESKDFETVRVSDFIEKHKINRNIENIFPASWINHNFDIWIGDDEDNRGWDLLQKTREFLKQIEIDFANGVSNKFVTKKTLEKALNEIYIAEGSDWFWWYGEDHSSENDAEFDELFRQHLKNVYTILGEYIPEEYNISVIKENQYLDLQKDTSFSEQIAPIFPSIDGSESNFLEWYNAGVFLTEKNSGSMHQVSKVVKKFYFGYDENYENFYFRIDLNNYNKDSNIIFRLVFKNFFDCIIQLLGGEVYCKVCSEENLDHINFLYDLLDLKGDIKFKTCIEMQLPTNILSNNLKDYNPDYIKILKDIDKIELKLKVLGGNKNIEIEEYPLYQNKIFIYNKFCF